MLQDLPNASLAVFAQVGRESWQECEHQCKELCVISLSLYLLLPPASHVKTALSPSSKRVQCCITVADLQLQTNGGSRIAECTPSCLSSLVLVPLVVSGTVDCADVALFTAPAALWVDADPALI